MRKAQEHAKLPPNSCRSWPGDDAYCTSSLLGNSLFDSATRDPMRMEYYRGEHILWAMGLEVPDRLPSSDRVLWIVFTPSWHPQVAVSFHSADGGSVHVYAFMEKLWQGSTVLRPPVVTESRPIEGERLELIWGCFERAYSVYDSARRYLGLDGMYIDVWGISPEACRELRAHVYGEQEFQDLARTAVEGCWHIISNPQLKNALANVGSYVGLKLPRQDVPVPLPTSNLLVLGTQEEREDYFRALNRHLQDSNEPLDANRLPPREPEA